MIFSLASDIGKVRKNNEDFIDSQIIYKDDDTKIGIFALADGMGGHNKGEVASAMAVNGIIEFLSQNLSQSGNIKIDYFIDPKILNNKREQAYNHVNLKIYEKSKEDESFNGMGTTLVTVVIYNEDMYVANVGDSRCYILREDDLKRITVDHSVVEDLVRMNIISEEEAMTHPIRNHITRAMGTDEMVIVDIFREKLKPQDKILMATDGLTGYVLDDKIKELLKKDEDLDVVTKNLINFANEVSGKDNTSVILIQKS